MLDLEWARGLAVIELLGTAAAVAASRPRRPIRSDPSQVEARGARSLGIETTWLVGVGVALLYPVGILLVPSWTYAAPWTARFPLDVVVQSIGVGLWAAGAVVLGLALVALGRFMAVEPEIRRDQPIVQRGVYARVRHPVYTSVVSLTFGFALSFLSPVLLVDGLVLSVVAAHRANVEERMFDASPRLGRAYADYRLRTGMFLPRVRWSGTRGNRLGGSGTDRRDP